MVEEHPIEIVCSPEWNTYDNDTPRRMLLDLSIVEKNEQPTTPLELVAVMDLSASMHPHRYTMRKIMEFFVKTMASKGAPRSSLAVLGFNTETCILLPKTQSTTLMDAHAVALGNKIRPQGGTDLALGLTSGLGLFSTTPTTSQVMVVISDGRSTRGETDCDRIRAAVNACPNSAQVAIHICTIGPNCSFEMLNQIASHSPGGVLQELRGGDPRPAHALGLMLGLAMYQLATNVKLSIHTEVGVPEIHGTACVGGMSVGEQRSFCITIPPGANMVTIRVDYQTPDDSGMHAKSYQTIYHFQHPQAHRVHNASVSAEFTLRDVMQRLEEEQKLDTSDIIDLQQTVRAAGALLEKGSVHADKLDRLHARLRMLLLSIDHNPLQSERVARSMANEFVRQRSSTYEGVEVDCEGPLPPMPSLVRAISISASTYLKDTLPLLSRSTIDEWPPPSPTLLARDLSTPLLAEWPPLPSPTLLNREPDTHSSS
jgi:Mg-chelatase subunit ChlD